MIKSNPCLFILILDKKKVNLLQTTSSIQIGEVQVGYLSIEMIFFLLSRLVTSYSLMKTLKGKLVALYFFKKYAMVVLLSYELNL